MFLAVADNTSRLTFIMPDITKPNLIIIVLLYGFSDKTTTNTLSHEHASECVQDTTHHS